MNVPSVVGEAGLYHAASLHTPGAGITQRIRMVDGCYNRARMTLQERIQDYIEVHQLLQPGQRLVAGVSGGADSLCLLHVLVNLGYKPIVAHFDHGLRPESADEADFVADQARRLGCEFVLEQASTGLFDSDSDASIEAAARTARYRFFASTAATHHLSTIATGHTADDQAETILLHLLRGAGPGGLRGMLPVTDLGTWPMLPDNSSLHLVRPMLGETHEAAVDFCERSELAFQHDHSNRDLRFTRNRIRHELLPLLETFNPRIREGLNRLAEILVEDVALIDHLVETARQGVVTTPARGRSELSVPGFLLLPPAIQRGLLRGLFMELLGMDGEVGLEEVERLRKFILDPRRPRALQMTGSLRVQDGGEKIFFIQLNEMDPTLRYPQTCVEEPTVIPIPGELELAAGWRIRASLEETQEDRIAWLKYDWPNRIVLNPNLAREELMIRNRNPGDRMGLFGSNATQKISDLMIDRKVPPEARDRWPLLVAGDEIVWALGLARSAAGAVSSEARQALVMELLPPRFDN
jgi:tRNA(Ile)-lysidine synthase